MKHYIVVNLNNVSREEQAELREYLEQNCWSWQEKESEEDD